MKSDARRVTAWVFKRLGREGLEAFLDEFGGLRITLPTLRDKAAAGRDASILEAYRQAQRPLDLATFYRHQARHWRCSSRTVQRALERGLKQAA